MHVWYQNLKFLITVLVLYRWVIASAWANEPSNPPQNVTVEAIGSFALRVSWTEPLPNQPIEPQEHLMGYYVGYRLAKFGPGQPLLFNHAPLSVHEFVKNHNITVRNLKSYTDYSIVVQAYNNFGNGPSSKEVIHRTGEGRPDEPPGNVSCSVLTSKSVQISWIPPPLSSVNGIIKGYQIFYGPTSTWYNLKTRKSKITQNLETILDGLQKYANYNFEVLAFTRAASGERSSPISCQTREDIPGSPKAIKIIKLAQNSVLISWLAPAQANGILTYFTIYRKTEGENHPEVVKVELPSSETTLQVNGLAPNKIYRFWVTASTEFGEGGSSNPAEIVTKDESVSPVEAKIVDFEHKFTVKEGLDLQLPCRVVGEPPLEIKWEVNGQPLQENSRLLLSVNFTTLSLTNVTFLDAGHYKCSVENLLSQDEITHSLIVISSPGKPSISLVSTGETSIQIRIQSELTSSLPIQFHAIHYKREVDDFEKVANVVPEVAETEYRIDQLSCGTKYQFYVLSYNPIGVSSASEILYTRTLGNLPIQPADHFFIQEAVIGVTLHLSSWNDGGCPIFSFEIEFKQTQSEDWTVVRNGSEPIENFVAVELLPGIAYEFNVKAINNVGHTTAEYQYTIPLNQVLSLQENSAIFGDLTMILILIAAVILIASLTSCLICGTKK